MAGGVVALCDVQVLFLCVVGGFLNLRHRNKRLKHVAKKCYSWLDLSLWIVGLNSGRDDCNFKALGAHGMGGAHHSDVNVRVALELLLG